MDATKPVQVTDLSSRIGDLKSFSVLILTVLVFTVVSAIPVYNQITNSGRQITYNDYNGHIDYALTILETRQITSPHFLYQLQIFGIYHLTPLSVNASALSASAFNYAFTGLVVFWWVVHSVQLPTRFGLLYAAGTVFLINMVTPITFLNLPHNLYHGYLYNNSYHNPTIVLIKPLTIILFLATLHAFRPSSGRKAWWQVGTVALATILSAIAKPNYLIVLGPLCAVLTLNALVRRQSVDWPLLIAGIGIPAGILLVLQYSGTYSGQEATSILFRPLEVWRARSDNLFPKFLLSIAFPLIITVLYWKQARGNRALLLAWSAYGIGAFYAYMLVEDGSRFLHGNFAWSGQIVSYMLYAVTIIFFLQQVFRVNEQGRPHMLFDWRLRIAGSVLLLHSISGIFWYFAHF